jgi:pyruvate dehydrogenase E2 component (dihydrolipoamide acetyltransferase)
VSVFRLPDLGEGLQEAEITEWHVAVGDEVKLDQPLVSVETAKAIIDIPSPQAGRIEKLLGAPGDILQVGDVLVEFKGDGKGVETTPATGRVAASDAGTVVGRVEKGAEVSKEVATAAGGRNGKAPVKATPAVRALARRLEVDLAVVTPSGPNDTVTVADVERVARIFKELGPLERLRGVRRTMARAMAHAHAEVAPATVNDDADLGAWWPGDLMLRLIRAIVAGCRAEPSLNAWFDSQALGRRVLEKIHLGIAVDTADGLFVPVLRDVGGRDADDLRHGLERLRADVVARTIPPEEMRGFTFVLSNYGTFGGRYASPMVQPPTVAILGAGRVRREPVVVDDQVAIRPVLPLSLTFDHRAVTGGEATRFIAAAIADLQLDA